jgi:glycerol kinase
VNIYGMLDPAILGRQIPVAAMAGDQHAALFGQACFEPGMAKNTYGTGCFMLANIGGHPVESKHQLINTVAWKIHGETTYALEGSVFVAGAAIQWLRDEMGLIERAADSEALALSLKDNGGVYLVPAFTGLGAPWWDMYSRGTVVGLTRGTGRAHIVRAALEAIAYQSHDLLEAIVLDCGHKPPVLRVDGGASANGFLMQFQTDLLQVPVARPRVIETTALGVAWMAGLGVGLYRDLAELSSLWQEDLTLRPAMPDEERRRNLKGWRRAVDRSRNWLAKE